MAEERILVIDDDPKISFALRQAFEQYDIVGVLSGAEAVQMLSKSHDIDLVILDIQLADMNGIDVLTQIRKVNPDLGVIIFTGFGSKQIVVKALQQHADDYIEKPFEPDELQKKIEQLLKKVGQDTPYVSDVERRIQRAIRFLYRNYTKDVTLTDAARVACLSPKYFSRVFKNNTGKTFTDYKIQVRIDAAKKLLQESHHDIGYIARAVGYENAESFMKVFKRLLRCTPSEYRRNPPRTIAAAPAKNKAVISTEPSIN